MFEFLFRRKMKKPLLDCSKVPIHRDLWEDKYGEIIQLNRSQCDIGDEREFSDGINTVLEESLEVILSKQRFAGKRVLEVGPKYGYHSKWIDKNLSPSMLTMVELPQKGPEYVHKWIEDIKCPKEVVYTSLFDCQTLLGREKYDLIFCTGVLYHTVEHFKLLNILRRLLSDNGVLLFQTSICIDSVGPVIRLNWKGFEHKASYAYPTKSALYCMLAMTGWANVTIFERYRPTSNTVLMTCEKSQALPISYDHLPFGGSTV